ncbi:XRE family transcriptional regulator [Adhaeribacter aquaticus]|uniref:XRE family transcriptional regulator n=1 Tax=Adhaeribacter aquaticus TaxID=299567 RepID=UPI0008FEFC69|nr:helix-turn-helix domain-containing protein [Adhaeribacter aquaticus]
MSSLGLRIKQLREAKGMTKIALASLAGLSGQGIADIEKGESKDPGSMAMLRIADYFQVNLIWLLTGKGEKHKSDKSEITTTELKTTDEVIVITPDTSDSVVVPMIDMKAAANFISGYQSSDYYNNLGHTTLPGYMAKGGTHYWLQVTGDSMETTLFEGDWLLCEQIPRGQWHTAEDFSIHVVVSKDRGVQVKRIKNRIKSKGFLRCRSDNRAHKPYSVVHDDILGLWKVKWYLSNYMPNRNEDLFNKVDTVEENVEDLRALTEQLMEEMNRIKKQLPPKP